jgi:membrane protein DedA with SNARE-associated domain
MDDFFAHFLGHPVLQVFLLFVTPLVLEEAAILSAAVLAAGGELGAPIAFAAVYAGIVVSDWLLYAAGVAAGRSRRIRGWLGEDVIARGRGILHRGAFAAAVTARLVPWLLFPIFVASGFLGVSFARFALVNALVALVYTAAAFLGLYFFNVALFELFDGWGWLAASVAAVVMLAALLIARRLYRDDDRADAE